MKANPVSRNFAGTLWYAAMTDAESEEEPFLITQECRATTKR